MKTKIICLRLTVDTVAKLEDMAKFDGRNMEERLSEIVEELVRRA